MDSLEKFLLFDLPFKKLYRLSSALKKIGLGTYEKFDENSNGNIFNFGYFSFVLTLIFFCQESRFIDNNYYYYWCQRNNFFSNDSNYLKDIISRANLYNITDIDKLLLLTDKYKIFYIYSLLNLNIPWSIFIKRSDNDDYGIKKFLNSFILSDYFKVNSIIDLNKNFTKFLKQNRKTLNYPLFPYCLVLVEGYSEEIVLPHIASLMGYNFIENGVLVHSANGADRVVKLYFKFRQIFNFPIISILDGDAANQADCIERQIRPYDKVLLLPVKELENCFDYVKIDDLILRHPNFLLFNDKTIDLKEFKNSKTWLNQFAKISGISHFSKIDFAKALTNTINDKDFIPDSVKIIINQIKNSQQIFFQAIE